MKTIGPARERGIGKFGIFVIFVFIAAFIIFISKIASRQAPDIRLTTRLKGLGQSTMLQFEVRDPRHAIKAVQVEVLEDGKTFQAPLHTVSFGEEPPPWWMFWGRAKENSQTVSAMVGRNAVPEMKEGRAQLRIVATNNSWGRFFRGGRSEVTLDLPVRFTPPQVSVLTSQHYINQGGCDMVMFKVSPGTTESGVEVGKYFFPSFPAKESDPQTRLCLFAYSYETDPSAPARIVARDDAGNQTIATFTYRVFPKKFHSDTINLSDDFMNRVVPSIMSQTPDLKDEGNLLKNFLEINGHLRQVDADELVKLSHQTASHFLWTEPFVRLPAKTEAFFADARTYTYNGQVVDHQVHLGFDLAGLEHMPVQAANDGVVVHAGFLGIYGNAVVIDHGCGLQTLYGHLSSIEVKEGDHVKRGQEIGRSGQTGLAGGDHLHFTVLLDGVPVNPTEWWDPHWIHDRIEAKLAEYR